MYTKKFENNIVPRPTYWAGIKICPKKFEFWQEKKSLDFTKENCFELKNKVWIKKILSPNIMQLFLIFSLSNTDFKASARIFDHFFCMIW